MWAALTIARALPFVVTLGAVACSGSRAPRAQPTSAQIAAAGSPELRTVDNAGYVDPGGRTRQVTAGTGPSVVGRGEGVAPLQPERASGSATPAPPPPVPIPAPADETDFNERAARALCDRELACDRLGAGKAFESADACVAEKRVRVRRARGEASCDEIRGDRVAACLVAIRALACGAPDARLEPPAECREHAVCVGSP
jgi:hypothetical protein